MSLIVLNLECTSSGRSPRNLAEFQVVENNFCYARPITRQRSIKTRHVEFNEITCREFVPLVFRILDFPVSCSLSKESVLCFVLTFFSNRWWHLLIDENSIHARKKQLRWHFIKTCWSIKIYILMRNINLSFLKHNNYFQILYTLRYQSFFFQLPV